MPFEQARFLGSSVRGINSSIGWNGESSRLVVSLADDVNSGDSFAPVEPGQPIYFNLGSYRFYGHLKKWTRNQDVNGFPTYEVECGDPRSLLEATQLILSGYNGTTGGVKNLLNIYGFWENEVIFGASQVNDSGIPWKKVRDALLLLVNQSSYTDYGGPITYKGYTYTLDLQELPVLPDYFRIPAAASISILDFVQFVCDYAGSDFFVELDQLKIKVRVASRYTQPPLGTISALVNTTDNEDVVRSSSGLEERNEVTSAFLVGGQSHILYKSSSIESFWGFDINQNPIIGRTKYFHFYDSNNQYLGTHLGQEIDLNASTVADILGQVYYRTTSYELRAALVSQEAWTAYISRFRQNINQLLESPDTGQANPRNRAENPNDRVRARINEVSNLNTIASGQDQGRLTKTQRMYEFVKFYAQNYMGRQFLARLPFLLYKRDLETLVTSYSYEIADAGYTEQTTVFANGLDYDLEDDLDGLPALYSDSFKSQDGRYIPFVYFSGFTLGRADFSKLDVGSSILTNNQLYARCEVDNRIVFIPEPAAIVKINPIYELEQNTGGMSLDDNFYRGSRVDAQDDNNPGQTVTVDGVRYATRIPFRITGRHNNGQVSAFTQLNDRRGTLVHQGGRTWTATLLINNNLTQVTVTWTAGATTFHYTANIQIPLNNPLNLNLTIDNDRRRQRNPLTAQFAYTGAEGRLRLIIGADANNQHRQTQGGSVQVNMHPPPIPITTAHIALRSNVLYYGPWFAGTTAGKVHFEQDSSLVPWNYGGYSVMDLVGNTKVTSLVTNMNVSETGFVEKEGLPTYSLGDLIDNAGPNLTRINVSFGEKGVTTSYYFETFIPRFGQIAKYFTDKVQRNAQILANLQRNARQVARQSLVRNVVLGQAAAGAGANYLANMRRNMRRQSPHTVFFTSSMLDEADTGGTFVRPLVSLTTLDEALAGCGADDDGDDARNTIVDLSTLVRPISIFGSGHYMSPMDGPSGDWHTTGLNSYQLNPLFISEFGHDYDILSYGDTAYEGVHHYRDNVGAIPVLKNFMALRAPLVLTGWGYSISGVLVPSDADYLYRSDKWKTGPVDALWDDMRKVWTVHGFVKGKVIQAITGRTADALGFGYIDMYKGTRNQHAKLLVMNTMTTGADVGTWVHATFDPSENAYMLTAADCSS